MKENHETEQNLHNRTVPVRFLSGKAQKIEELPAVPLQIGYEKTLHLIFPTEVKYYSIGGDYVIGEKVGNCPEIIRLKAPRRISPGETTLSVVTADTKFYSYAISYNAHPVESYVRVDGQAPAPPYTAGGERTGRCSSFSPAGITYVDYGSTNVEVEKAEGVDNILAVKATGEFTEDTNISAVVEGGKFYTFNLHYALSRNVSALSLTRKRRKGWPSLTRGNGQANRRKGSDRQSRRGFPWTWD